MARAKRGRVIRSEVGPEAQAAHGGRTAETTGSSRPRSSGGAGRVARMGALLSLIFDGAGRAKGGGDLWGGGSAQRRGQRRGGEQRKRPVHPPPAKGGGGGGARLVSGGAAAPLPPAATPP